MLCSQCSEIQNKHTKLYHPGSTDGKLSHLRGKLKKPDVSHKTEPHLPLSCLLCASGQTELEDCHWKWGESILFAPENHYWMDQWFLQISVLHMATFSLNETCSFITKLNHKITTRLTDKTKELLYPYNWVNNLKPIQGISGFLHIRVGKEQ